MDIIFNAYSSNVPILLKDVRIDVFAGLGGGKVRINDEPAKVDLKGYLASKRSKRVRNSYTWFNCDN